MELLLCPCTFNACLFPVNDIWRRVLINEIFIMKEIIKALITPKGLKNLILNYPIFMRALKVKLFYSVNFYGSIGTTKTEYQGYIEEIKEDEINDYLENELKIFSHIRGKTVRGYEYSSGAISKRHGHNLYAMIRTVKPDRTIETGTANGYSTSFILKALEKNDRGILYTIDYPEVEGKEYPPDDFYKEKGGAVIPKGRQSGWLVPDALRERCKLFIGRSQDILPQLFKTVGEIDIFFHDSEHTYKAMLFEFETAWPYLRPGGILLAHDVNWNNAFTDFAKKVLRTPFFIDGSLGFLIK